ncbi:MAG TPA: serpin family protein, partial [Streptosporangiaceae bacterium]|nr:serpin family protein [Streptosporangiaceae bacterium]
MTNTGACARARDVAACTALAAALAVAAGGCGSASRQGQDTHSAVLTSQQTLTLRALGQSDTTFGLNVFGALCKADPAANVMLSPASLATGLGLADLGARGTTQAAIARVLHLPAGGNTLVRGLAARSSLLATLNRPGVTFAASNRVWADPGLATNPGYLAQVRAAYQAGLRDVPLLTQPESARTTINAAISNDTHGHIPDLLPPGSLSQVGWVLTDAL